jgi:transposase
VAERDKKDQLRIVGRGELMDEAWRQIMPLLPGRGTRGGQWRDHRTVIYGILWKLRTGAPWRDLPERYGPWQTCADRLYRWRRDGTWDRILALIRWHNHRSDPHTPGSSGMWGVSSVSEWGER